MRNLRRLSKYKEKLSKASFYLQTWYYLDNMTTRDQVNRHIPNPTGKGGFQERPQDRNSGTWNKDESISFQYNKLLRTSPEQLDEFIPTTVAQKIALQRLKMAMSEKGLDDTKEISDRTEGKSPQSIDLTNNGKSFEPIVVRIINEPIRDNNTSGV